MKCREMISLSAAILVLVTMRLPAQEPSPEHGSGGMMIGTIPMEVVETDSGTVTNDPVTILLPLKQTDIAVEMIPGVISADVRQLFFNDSEEHIEANYIFPLPQDATISEMIITINEERVIRSVVKEREEAKKTYEEAKKAGKRTALLNRNGGNMMNMKIANLAPGDSAEVHLVYFQSSSFDNGTYRLTVPTVVAKQYVPPEIWENVDKIDPVRLEGIVENELAPRLPPGVASDHHFSFSASFSGMEVVRITSPSHKIIVTQGETAIDHRIALADSVSYPDRDVVIDIEVKEPENAASSFLSSEIDGEFFTAVSVVPAFDMEPVESSDSREIIFVIDTSSSMSGTPLSQAKEGIVRAFGYLKAGDLFSVYEFNSEFQTLVSNAVAEPDGLADAAELVESLQSRGGTEFLPVIKHILDQGKTTDQRIVIFLTDGQSCNENFVLQRIMMDETGTKFFPVSIGSAPNMTLLTKMAETGRGTVTSIYNEKGIAEAVEKLFAKLQKPVMTDIELKLVDGRGVELDAEIYPTVFPDLFAGLPVKCNIRHRQIAGVSLVMTGVSRGMRQEMRCPLADNIITSDAVAQMFGQALINDLESQMLVADSDAERKMIKDVIVRNALDFQLVCQYTSRVAVEELIERLPDNTIRYVPVPLHTPHGVLESTATGDFAQLLAGGCLLLLAAGLFVSARLMIADNSRIESLD